jgi:predicted flavoprotein YhiN
VEQWGADGKTKVRFLPENEFYEIPARSLRAAKIKNLFMAGKTISADVDAIASARVMGCCLATGAAAAKLATGH